MSNGESFFARWSRRKRTALGRARQPRLPEQKQTRPAEAADTAPDAEPVLDISELPPIESIGPGSDIRAFLAPGVPVRLARAALRRVWSSDPAIRDFVGLSENSWDFTTPAGVPGFGALTADDAERLLARLQPDREAVPGQAAELISKEQAPEQVPAMQSEAAERPETSPEETTLDRLTAPGQVAPESGSAEYDASLDPKRRRHGSALPE